MIAPSSSSSTFVMPGFVLLERLEQVHGLHVFLQQLAALGHELLVLQALQDRQLQFLRMAGLEQEAVDLALVDGAHRRFEVRLTRQDHANGVGPLLAHFREQLAAGHAGHAFVGDDDVDVVAREDHQGLLRGVGGEDLELRPVEAANQRRGEVRLVVDQK